MPNRREFLQTGAAVSAIAANGVIARSAEAAGAAPRRALGRVVYDDRYAEGRRFAAVAAAQGIPTQALEAGDITRLYDELARLWPREPGAIAGVTQFGPMLVVERLAAEHSMRLAMCVEHCPASGEALAHRFTGPHETLALAAGLETLASDWPGVMATLACRVGADDSPLRSGELVTPGLPPALPEEAPSPASSFVHYYTPVRVQQGYAPALDGPLYSWVVAPQRGPHAETT